MERIYAVKISAGMATHKVFVKAKSLEHAADIVAVAAYAVLEKAGLLLSADEIAKADG